MDKKTKVIVGIVVVLALVLVIVALAKERSSGQAKNAPLALVGSLVDQSLAEAKMKANDAVRKADIKQVGALLDQYKLENGSYPVTTNAQALDTGVLDAVAAIAGISGAIMENGPLGADDDYLYFSDGSRYTLSVMLEETGELYVYPPEPVIVN